MHTEPEPDYLTSAEVADLLHVSPSWLRYLREDGRVEAFRPYEGANWRYPAGQPVLTAARDRARATAAARS